LQHATTFSYNQNGGLQYIQDALGDQTVFVDNSAGQVLKITDSLQDPPVQFTYDGADLVSSIDPLGRTTAFFTDGVGRVISVTDPANGATHYQFDALDNLTQVTDPLGGTTSLAYDQNGNVLAVTDAKGHATTYSYDSRDRVVGRVDSLGRSEGYQYDFEGNLTAFTDRRGRVSVYQYDALRRRTFAGFGLQGSSYESTINYVYDAGNRLTQAIDSTSGTLTRGYDGLGRLTSETTSLGSIGYTYDAWGRRTTMSVSNQPIINYSYDNANRLTQIAQGTTVVGLGYDAANRKTSLMLPNGVTLSYGYDVASELTGVTYSLNSTTLGNLTYSYDLAGRRSSVGGSYARTGLPNAVSTATLDSANELAVWGTVTPIYDANGNLLNDGGNSYVWNGRNQLILMNGSAESFQYDAFGRRAAKTILGTTTNYLYDGANIVQELSGTTPTANLITGRVDEYFQRTDSTGAASFLTDALGSTVALTNASGGNVAQYTYDPHGNTTVAGSSTSAFQFTGRENDNTALYYYRARYLSPGIDRFISEDPLGLAGGINDYAYAGNDPVDNADSSGMLSSNNHFEITFSAAIAAGYSPQEAYKMALDNAMSDFAPDSQKADALDANFHAMAGRKPNGKQQPCSDAVAGTAQRLGDALKANELGPATHTVQDAPAAGHRFQFWPGGWPSLSHEFNDFFPDAETYDQAWTNTYQLLTDVRGHSVNSDLTSYLKIPGGPPCSK